MRGFEKDVQMEEGELGGRVVASTRHASKTRSVVDAGSVSQV